MAVNPCIGIEATMFTGTGVELEQSSIVIKIYTQNFSYSSCMNIQQKQHLHIFFMLKMKHYTVVTCSSSHCKLRLE